MGLESGSFGGNCARGRAGGRGAFDGKCLAGFEEEEGGEEVRKAEESKREEKEEEAIKR